MILICQILSSPSFLFLSSSAPASPSFLLYPLVFFFSAPLFPPLLLSFVQCETRSFVRKKENQKEGRKNGREEGRKERRTGKKGRRKEGRKIGRENEPNANGLKECMQEIDC
jgi:hypothetical protein